MTEYQLFPDIRLIVGTADGIADKGKLAISFCISGICEYKIGNEYNYLTADTCMIVHNKGSADCHISHSPDFCSITLLISRRYSEPAFSDILDIPNILTDIPDSGNYIFKAGDNMRKLFSEIYTEAKNTRTSMLKIKVLELIAMLGDNNELSFKHDNISGQIGQYICKNISEHYTIDQLSGIFKVNATTLKNRFKQRYCCTVYDYAKKRKMFKAAELMNGTDMKIIDIAEEVGYSNASKFSSAFRSVMGTTPKRFRMEQIRVTHFKNTGISTKIAY